MSYQTYTADTPIDSYRADFIHRGAMCAALAKRYPELAATEPVPAAPAAPIEP